MNPIKVLFLTHRFAPDIGGTEANAELLATQFHGFGAEVRLLTWTSKSTVRLFPFAVIRNPTTMTLIKEFFWADVVFENHIALRLSWPNILFRKPLIVALNTWVSHEAKRNSLLARFKYWWLGKAFEVTAVSSAIQRNSWPGATVIENAYNDELFLHHTAWGSRAKDFVFLGRLVSDKGTDLAIEAMAMLARQKRQGSQLSLTIIGQGPELDGLKEQASALKLDNVVCFVGPKRGEELVDLLNQHKYMLIPSVWEEPFGIVALEGMACGCIPIASDSGGLPDAVGKAGLLFKNRDVKHMVDVITTLLEDEKLEAAILNAIPGHLAQHSPAMISKKYFDVIQHAYITKG